MQCDPRTLLRTNGEDLHYWQEVVAQTQKRGDEASYYRARLQVQEALEALDLIANPPRCAIRHHLSFTGVATQLYTLDPKFSAAAEAIWAADHTR